MKHADMTRSKKRRKWQLAGGAAALLLGGVAAAVQHPSLLWKARGQATGTQSGFQCNATALTPAERVQHKQLTDKLLAARKTAAEMENGYDFQYPAGSVSLAELADWVVKESKCCPFFDFHIDVEEQGTLVCLRLTGKEGVKQFIRAEFGLDSN